MDEPLCPTCGKVKCAFDADCSDTFHIIKPEELLTMADYTPPSEPLKNDGMGSRCSVCFGPMGECEH